MKTKDQIGELYHLADDLMRNGDIKRANMCNNLADMLEELRHIPASSVRDAYEQTDKDAVVFEFPI